MVDLPVRVTADDDLARSRLTVFFRLLLALPHLVWWGLWSAVALLLYLVVTVIAVILGRLPDWAHAFFSAYVRYSLHLYAYLTLAANPYPGFVGAPGSYPVDVEFDPPVAQNRWSLAFRWILDVPALLLAGALSGSGNSSSIGVAEVAGFLGWFVAMVRGEVPRGLRDATVYSLGYTTQAYAYAFLLTPRYPSSDPSPAPVAPLPEHPVTLDIRDGDLHRSRLTVFFRLLLALPHLVWLYLWGIVAYLAALIGWVVALFTGRLPDPLHGFIRAYVRQQVHVSAYLQLAANPFPGFTGAPGTYPIEVDVPDAERQSRWLIFFRLWLTLPALLIAAALGGAAFTGAVLAWFYALFTSRMPHGIRNLIAYALRYSAQMYAYGLLLTPRYPFSGPGPLERPAPAPLAAAVPEVA